jgi:hypothetical protein
MDIDEYPVGFTVAWKLQVILRRLGARDFYCGRRHRTPPYIVMSPQVAMPVLGRSDRALHNSLGNLSSHAAELELDSSDES